MRLRLDRHIWLWLSTAPEKITSAVRDAIRARDNDRVFSAAVAHEISINWALGKLTLPAPAEVWIHERIASFDAGALAISIRHATAAGSLPPHHRDPFDRLLVAQATCDGLTLVTADPAMKLYDVPLLWAT